MAKGARGNKNISVVGGGKSVAPASNLTQDTKTRITNGIETHTKEQNDKAEQSYLNNIERQKEIISNYDNYIKTGYIKSKNDEWWKNHEDTYNSLQAQLKFFRKERRRLKK